MVPQRLCSAVQCSVQCSVQAVRWEEGLGVEATGGVPGCAGAAGVWWVLVMWVCGFAGSG